MADQIFREKSLQRVKSPDELNDYIKVSRPSTWLILGAIIVFLVGVVVWGTFGKINVTVSGLSLVENGRIYTVVDAEKEFPRIKTGMEMRVGEVRGEVEVLYDERRILGDVADEYSVYTGKYDRNMEVCLVEGTMRMANGSYEATIILESVSPISLLVN